MTAANTTNKAPLIIDLDGVLRIDNEVAKGVEDFFQFINEENIPACILSNTTLLSADSIVEFFDENNISLGNIKVLTALDITVKYVSENYQTYSVYCNENSKGLFPNVANVLGNSFEVKSSARG